MLGAIAQFETEIRAERQRDGIENAKARGVPFGRHRMLTPQHIAELRARRTEGMPISRLMHDFRVFKATIYRYLGQVGPDHIATADNASL